MRCKNCPYGREDFEKYKSYVDLHDIQQYIWCDKVGGKVYYFGYCFDKCKPNKKKRKSYTEKKRINKHKRYWKYQNDLKRLHEAVKGYPAPVEYVDKVWVKGIGYVKLSKPYYRRLYRGKNSKYLKRQSNKQIRRYKGELHKGNFCHLLYDFWWELT